MKDVNKKAKYDDLTRSHFPSGNEYGNNSNKTNSNN